LKTTGFAISKLSKYHFNKDFEYLCRFELKLKVMNKLIVNRLDYARIRKCISDAKQFKSITDVEAERLMKELDSARILEPENIPSNVVTMNSIVKLSFVKTNKQVQFQIVHPDKANIKENKISIFSPIATALIGYKINDEIEWIVPAGLTKLRIDEIIYQPEAAGDFDL
jgi:regulator of nucleoside diphosphate kinase